MFSLAEFNEMYGPIALEVTTSGFPIVHLFDRVDIERVLRFPSKYPFRPPTEIVSIYRSSRPDRYASVGITNEQVFYVGSIFIPLNNTRIEDAK